ncbi:MAG TPA: hypothetical protein PL182_04950 [Pseudobdellovibrionaceae bacterium]|nr:hypothetical protein [Pseudobdellovibrionaceae bacterium]
MFKRSWAFALLTLFSPASFADGVHLDVLFSAPFIGAVDCWKAHADHDCSRAVPVYDSAGNAKGSEQAPRGVCVVAIGCAARVLVLEKKDIGNNELLVRTHAKSEEEIWIKVPSISIQSMAEIMPELSLGYNDVSFRKDLTHVFSKKDLSEKIPVEEVLCPAAARNEEASTPQCEYAEIGTFKIDGREYLEIEVRLFLPSNEPPQEDFVTAAKKAPKKPLLRFYFPKYDNKGRLNYWYQPMTC